MSNLTTLPKGDSAWLLRKSIQRIIQQVSVLETNIGSSTTGNSSNTQIIFNDAGTLRGDSGLTYNKTTDVLSVGAATITGDLTVDTSTLKVDSANDRVGIGIATPAWPLDIRSATAIAQILSTTGTNAAYLQVSNTGGFFYLGRENSAGTSFASPAYSAVLYAGGAYPLVTTVNGSERYRIASDGVATWSNVGGVAGTAMTLNSTGLGIGVSPSNNLHVQGASGATAIRISAVTDGTLGFIGSASGLISGSPANNLAVRAENGLYLSGGGNATQFILNSSGNVGIGVTPSLWNWAGIKALEIGYVGNGLLSWASSETYLLSNTYYNSGFKYGTAVGASYYRQLQGVHSWHTNSNSPSAGGSATFTQAMTLTAAGELLVGTTSTGGVFDTKFFLSSNSGTNKWAVGPYGTATNFAIIPTPGTGGVYLSGTSATSWTAYSDERLKDIIEPITNALTKIGSLRSVIGKFKGDETNTRRPFLIAQDLQSALPEAVDASNPDRLGVAYTDVIPLLVAAIKELTARVQTIETR